MNTQSTQLAIIPKWLIALFGVCVISLNYAHAQITLTYKNYLVSPTADYFYQGADAAGVAIPSQGTNQIWDYSSLVNNDQNSYSESDVPASNPAFPTAIRKASNYYFIAGIPVLIDIYQSDNANSFSSPGRHIDRQAFSIALITGGPNDSLIIDWQDLPNTASYVYQKYPVSYSSNWTSTFRQVNNYELSVAAFGLDHVPGQFVQNIIETREVVGTGKARVPTSSGPSNYINALLEKITNTTIDSVYLGGAPADPALLAAFGITQGNVGGFNQYRIFRKGIDAWLLNFFMDPTFTTTNGLNYDTKYVDIYCSGGVELCMNGVTKCVSFNNATHAIRHGATVGACGDPKYASVETQNTNLFEVSAYPNPSSNLFTLNMVVSNEDPVMIRVVDLSGKLIQQFTTSDHTIEVGQSLQSGIYFIQVSQGNTRQIVKVVKTD